VEEKGWKFTQAGGDISFLPQACTIGQASGPLFLNGAFVRGVVPGTLSMGRGAVTGLGHRLPTFKMGIVRFGGACLRGVALACASTR
jgi:hypothetical protein